MRYIYAIVAVILVALAIISIRMMLMPEREQPTVSSYQTKNFSMAKVSQHLSKALQFKTVSAYAKRDASQFSKLRDYLGATYFSVFEKLDVQSSPGQSLLLYWPGKDKSLKPALFIAHFDVVPEGDDKDWTYLPFSGAMKQGAIWGRGALDDKSQVISSMEAIQLLLSKGYQPQRDLYFYFGDDEEVGGKSAVQLAQQWQDKGLRFFAIFDEGGAVVKKLIPKLKRTAALIAIAEKGILDLQLKATAAKGGHASMPPKRTVIALMSHAISKLDELSKHQQVTPIARDFMSHIDRYLPLPQRMIFANPELFTGQVMKYFSRSPLTRTMLKTTMVPTIFNAGYKSNVIPIAATAIINIRLLPNDSEKSVENKVRRVVAPYDVKVVPVSYTQNRHISSAKTMAYKELQQSIWQSAGMDLVITPWVTMVATDSRHFAMLADNIYRFRAYTIRPKALVSIHGHNEHITQNSLRDMVNQTQILLQEIGSLDN